MLFPMEQYLGGSDIMIRLQEANVGSVVMRDLPGDVDMIGHWIYWRFWQVWHTGFAMYILVSIINIDIWVQYLWKFHWTSFGEACWIYANPWYRAFEGHIVGDTEVLSSNIEWNIACQLLWDISDFVDWNFSVGDGSFWIRTFHAFFTKKKRK